MSNETSTQLTLYRYGSEWTSRPPGLDVHATQPDERAEFVRLVRRGRVEPTLSLTEAERDV